MAKRSLKIAVVVKRTTYRKFIVEEHDPLMTRLIKKHDPTVVRLKQSHEAHEQTMREVDQAITKLGAEIVFRDGPRKHIPARIDLVVTVGGDGTLLAAQHQVSAKVPVLGVNSAPESSVGFFCGAKKGSVLTTLARALDGTLARTELTRMRVELNGKCLHGRVLNEALICHESPAATSRYIVQVTRANGAAAEEDQRSSGMWIGPAAGSTAAQRSAGGRVLPLTSRRIQYVVREPYTPAGGRLRFARGLLDEDGYLTLRNKMHDARVFLDGHRIVYAITTGDVLVMRRGDDPVTVLGIAAKRRV